MVFLLVCCSKGIIMSITMSGEIADACVEPGEPIGSCSKSNKVIIKETCFSEKVKGGFAKNLTKETVSMFARFCPFCGEDTKANDVWNLVSEVSPEIKEGEDARRVWAEWEDGSIEIATYMRYPQRDVFHRSCGTDEDGVGWKGKSVGKVR